jgi:hypothetical protein
MDRAISSKSKGLESLRKPKLRMYDQDDLNLNAVMENMDFNDRETIAIEITANKPGLP